jgi:hypothetical protein
MCHQRQCLDVLNVVQMSAFRGNMVLECQAVRNGSWRDFRGLVGCLGRTCAGQTERVTHPMQRFIVEVRQQDVEGFSEGQNIDIEKRNHSMSLPAHVLTLAKGDTIQRVRHKYGLHQYCKNVTEREFS